MALLNFPSPSSIGEQTTQNGNTWQWNGTSWIAFNNLSLSSQVTGILAVQYGGTGFGGTYTKGDLLYATSSNTFTKLAAGTAGSVLASSGPGGDLYWKLDAQGAGTVSTGTANEITYYDTTTSVNSATGITLVAGTKLTIGLGTSSTSTTTGAFIVYGGVGIGGSLWTTTSNYSSISGVGHQYGMITSGFWSGTAISLSNGGTNGTRSGNGVSYQLAVYNSVGSAITQIATSSSIANSILLQASEFSYPIWVSQSTLTSGIATSAAQVNLDATTATRYIVGTALSTASGSTQLSTGSGITIGNNLLTSGGIAVTNTTGTAATTGGALVVAGGVGIGGSLWTTTSNYSSISGVGHQYGMITSGFWSGTAISLAYGGTNGTRSGSAISYQVAVYNAAGTSITQIASGTASSVLFQSNAATAPSWVAQSALVVGSASTASRANTFDVTSAIANTTYYLAGVGTSTTLSAVTPYTSGTGVTFDTTSITATTFRGTATNLNVSTITNSTAYPLTFNNSGTIGSTTSIAASASTGAIFATTFIGNLSGTAVTGTHYGSGANLTNIVTSATASTGINITGTGSITIGNIGVISLQGTANQVLVGGGSGSATTGAITLTLPQNINTGAGITFANVTISDGAVSTVVNVGNQPTSMVNKQYVDNLASGLDIHGSVRAIQVSALSANYVQTQAAGSAATGAYLISTTQVALPNIDTTVGFAATGASQRILVNGGFTGTASIAGTTPFTPASSFIGNGIYYVSSVGSGSSNWILTRANDTDDNVELTGGTFTFVEEGTNYADSGWVCSNDTTNLGAIQFGGTGVSFTQFTGGGQLSVGQGLSKVGNVIGVNANITSSGTNTAGKWSAIAIGGAISGVAGTGFYPTFQIATGTAHAGTATLNLNADGFSLIGGTSSSQMLTVTGSGITLTGGGKTLTLSGDISLPSPTQHGIAYGSNSTTVAFLTAGGAGASVLTQTSGNAPVYTPQSQLAVGAATNISNGNQYQIPYQTNSNATGFITNAAGSGASVLTQTTGSAPVYLPQSQLAVGSASTASRANTFDVTSASSGTTYYLTGVAVSVGTNAVTPYTSGTGVTFDTNSITATTFRGTATNLNVSTITNGTAYPITFNNSGTIGSTTLITAIANTGAIVATTFIGNLSGTATSAAQVNTNASTATRYIVGTALSTASGSTQLSTGSGVYVGNNILTSGGIAVTDSTGSTATNSGALIVTGGVGIGGSLWTSTSNYASISGLGISNSVILSGFWSGTAISLSNGGTNGTRSGVGVSYELAVYNSTGMGITQITTSASIANSILLQSTELSYPTWVGQSQLIVGGATTAGQISTDASTSTRYIVGTALSVASSGGAQLSTGSGVYVGNNILTSGGIAITNNTASGSTSTGALIVTGGVGIGGSLWTTVSNFSSISGVGFQNSAITSGVWSGTAISTSKGGTGLITVNANEVLIGASTGNTWTAIGSTYLPVVGIGSNPPTQPGGAIGATQAGQLWWDSQYGVLKIFYVDGTPTPPGQWVDATPVLGSSGGGSSSKRSYVMSFGAGFTPSTGADTVSIQVPYAPDNSSQYYYIKRLDYRHETAGTGVQFYIERHNTGNASFSPSVRIHTAGSGTGASFVTTGAGIFITSYTLSSTGASFVSSSGVAGSVISGDYLRLNFTAINSAANMSISMVLEEQ